MSNHQQLPNPALHIVKGSLSQHSDTGVPFRLIADFVVETETATGFLNNSNLTSEQRSLFWSLLTNPEARNRISRLAIVCDLSAHECGEYFDGVFSGPSPEQILDCVLPYLPADLQEYWTRLRNEEYDCFASVIDEVFLQFRSSLKKVMIEDMTTGEEIPMRISESHRNKEESCPEDRAHLR